MPKELAGEFVGNTRFEIVRRIGAGGIGLVYEALDREHGMRVALKTLQRLDGEALLRFKNEFRLLQDIHHENLVQLGELFEEGGQWFFTMELLEGVDLMSHVVPYLAQERDEDAAARSPSFSIDLSGALSGGQDRAHSGGQTGEDSGEHSFGQSTNVHTATLPLRGRGAVLPEAPPRRRPRPAHHFDELRLRATLRQLAEGLHTLHRAGMVHRDIKPQNVMVCRDGRVVLLDFGLVSEERPWHRYDAEAGMVLGTPPYMAPEQAAGKPVTPASDWYAVGTMLYEALTGDRPFEGPMGHLLMAKQHRDPEPPSLRTAHPVPPDLERLCMELLARAPDRRPTGAEVLTRLASAADLLDASGPVPAIVDAGAELVGRSRELAALRDALARSSTGRPAVAFVHGISGMGKTALVERFAREARDRQDALVLRGRCYEREAVPFKALDGVVDELSRYLRHLRGDEDDELDSDDPLEPAAEDEGERTVFDWDFDTGFETDPGIDIGVLLDHEFSVLGRLFPVLEDVLAPPAGTGPIEDIRDPGELRRRAFGALKALLALLAGRQPLMLIIDDLQWGDMDSAALLSELLSPPNAPGMLLVASFRSEEAQSPMVAALRDSATRALGPESHHDIDVGPLDLEECQALALAVWQYMEPGEPDAPAGLSGLQGPGRPRGAGISLTPQGRAHILARAARESGGNPMFVVEMIRYLVTASHRDSGEIETDGITLDRVLVERRRQLPPAAQALLDVVAVAGRPIPQGVALSAAGLDGADMGVLAELRTAHLVRTRGPGLRDVIEIYHDRIREAVVAQMSEAALRDHHGRLAMTLEQRGSDDAEMLAEHYLGAGRVERAAAYALQAARHAERVLAFDRAVRMYRMVLALRPGEAAEQRILHLCLGNALANASRGADAADAYLAAAEIPLQPGLGSTHDGDGAHGGVADAVATAADAAAGNVTGDGPAAPDHAAGTSTALLAPSANSLDAVECKRRAAEQLLCSGNIDRGMTLLREIMRAVGVHAPWNKRRLLLRLFLRRLRLRIRGLGYRARAPEDIPLRERQRAAICWSGAVGLSTVDIIRGADFATRCLLMSLNQGNEPRIALAMALEACHRAYRGGRSVNYALTLTRTATHIARRVSDPQTHALTMFAPGAVAVYTGRWRRARVQLERAERIYLEKCTGVAWELTNVRLHLCLALYYLGEWALMGKRAATAVHHAADRGDQFTVALLAFFAAHDQLCGDDAAGAGRLLRLAGAGWTKRGYHLQHYYQLRGGVQIDLYTGNSAAAWERLSAELPAIRRSMLTRVQLTRIECAHTHARCALALAATGAGQTGQLLRTAAREAQHIERERTPWCQGLASLVRAGVAACRGERGAAMQRLDDAIAQLARADMRLYWATAQWQHGRLTNGIPGQRIMIAAEEIMRAKGITNFQATADLLAPGFGHLEQLAAPRS